MAKKKIKRGKRKREKLDPNRYLVWVWIHGEVLLLRFSPLFFFLFFSTARISKGTKFTVKFTVHILFNTIHTLFGTVHALFMRPIVTLFKKKY